MFRAKIESGVIALIARSARKVAKIVMMPTNSGNNAATNPRKTNSETMKSSGNAIASAFARSSPTCSPIVCPVTSSPPTSTPGSSSSSTLSRSAASSTSASSTSLKVAAMNVSVRSRDTNAAIARVVERLHAGDRGFAPDLPCQALHLGAHLRIGHPFIGADQRDQARARGGSRGLLDLVPGLGALGAGIGPGVAREDAGDRATDSGGE